VDATIGEAKKPKKLAGNAANEADEIESSADRSPAPFQKKQYAIENGVNSFRILSKFFAGRPPL
jgi:hypothetical protein